MTTENETYLVELSERLRTVLQGTSVGTLTEPEQVFVCAWELEAEVNNGGFSQFYFNSSGDHAVATVSALQRIGAKRTAKIVAKANALFSGGPQEDRDARQDELESLEDANPSCFEGLDQSFLEYQDDLSALLFAFVQQNRAQIRSA